nr:hypothetical protein DM860_006871 [Ipomoea trifida]
MNNQEATTTVTRKIEKEGKEDSPQPSASGMASSAIDDVSSTALPSVLQRVKQAGERCGRQSDRIRVVAMSKTKPASLICQVYDSGHCCFGENYVQELVDKAPKLPEDVLWHFFGNLQSNKVKMLATGVPNLAMVEILDDEKIANYLNRVVGNIGRKPLKVFVQVNTSGEETKSGIEPSACVVKHISSMGMSGDFELAIEMGSTNVRVRSTIFGAREYPIAR